MGAVPTKPRKFVNFFFEKIENPLVKKGLRYRATWNIFHQIETFERWNTQNVTYSFVENLLVTPPQTKRKQYTNRFLKKKVSKDIIIDIDGRRHNKNLESPVKYFYIVQKFSKREYLASNNSLCQRWTESEPPGRLII